MLLKRKTRMLIGTISFVLASIGTKVSFAYWANAVNGSNSNSTGTVNSGSWDRFTTGTAVSTCAGLQTMLQANTSATYHLTTSLSCPTTTLNTTNRTFSGIFYGNGFTISNFTMTNGRTGLFYTLSGATIQNLILSNINVGTSGSRVASYAGVLSGRINGANTVIKRVRIYSSSVYSSNANGAGTVSGYVTQSVSISNVMVQTVTINNSSTSAGGIIGRLNGNTATISDVYVEATINSTTGSGGVVGSVDNTANSVVVLNRAVVFGNTTLTTSTSYSGGAVGNNQRSSTSHSLTDVFYTGALNSTINRAGTISNNVAMTYSNAWCAQWSSSTIAAYTNMTGVSANYTTNYVALRSSLSSSWWSTNMPTIANSGYWTYDSGTYLYELKPKV